MQHSPSPYPLLGVLLLMSAVSFGFYLAAVKTTRAEREPVATSG
jgi:hypothetical protein